MDLGVYIEIPRRVRRRLATSSEKLDATVATLWRLFRWVVGILVLGGLAEWIAK